MPAGGGVPTARGQEERADALGVQPPEDGLPADGYRGSVRGVDDGVRGDAQVDLADLGVGGEGRRSFRNVKHYKRRKRWLA